VTDDLQQMTANFSS